MAAYRVSCLLIAVVVVGSCVWLDAARVPSADDVTPSTAYSLSSASLASAHPASPAGGLTSSADLPRSPKHLVFPMNLRTGVTNHTRALLGGAATLPLHGSVQEHGYYYADVALGTPPKQFQVIIDTGSTATYVPCAGCTACGIHTNPYFDPAASSSFKPIDCASPDCHTGRCSGGKCHYSKSYAERSSASGDLILDQIQLGGDLGGVDFVFGCTTSESGTILSQEADGLMGLGNGVVSLPMQLAARHSLERVFSLCYGSFDGGGAVSFGRLPTTANTPALAYTPLKPSGAHPTYYTVATDKWEVGGVAIASAADFNVGYGTVMDSGTTFTYVPTKVFNAFAAALHTQVGAKLIKIPGPDPGYPGDICYQGQGVSRATLGHHFPNLGIFFEAGAALDLPPSNYLFIHGKEGGAFCLGVMDNGGSGTLIGGITVRNTMVGRCRLTTVDPGWPALEAQIR